MLLHALCFYADYDGEVEAGDQKISENSLLCCWGFRINFLPLVLPGDPKDGEKDDVAAFNLGDRDFPLVKCNSIEVEKDCRRITAAQQQSTVVP